ncbi:MAG: hypothetical protein ACOVOR_03550 [Rhabdochlamydiaceae bacterium]
MSSSVSPITFIYNEELKLLNISESCLKSLVFPHKHTNWLIQVEKVDTVYKAILMEFKRECPAGAFTYERSSFLPVMVNKEELMEQAIEQAQQSFFIKR